MALESVGALHKDEGVDHRGHALAPAVDQQRARLGIELLDGLDQALDPERVELRWHRRAARTGVYVGHLVDGALDRRRAEGKLFNLEKRLSDEPLPPPIPPPLIGEIVLPPPPSYKAVVSERIRDPQGGLPRAEESLNRRQLIPPPADSSLSNQRPATVNPSSEPTYCNRDKERQKQSMRNTENVPMRILRENFISDYKKLKQERRVSAFYCQSVSGNVDFNCPFYVHSSQFLD